MQDVDDKLGRKIDLAPVRALLERIAVTWRPDQVWLYGSRARGEAKPGSDWDLFVVVPDDVADTEIEPLKTWRLRRESNVNADVVACHSSEFREARDTPNTIAYDVAREGVLIHER